MIYVFILCDVGFVIGRTKSSRGGYTSLFNLQKLQLVTNNGEQTAASNVQKKKFIVKVQVPMSECYENCFVVIGQASRVMS